jgi:hypothetical protein
MWPGGAGMTTQGMKFPPENACFRAIVKNFLRTWMGSVYLYQPC